MDMDAKTKFLHIGGSSSYHGCSYCVVKGIHDGHVYLIEKPTQLRNAKTLLLDFQNKNHLAVRGLPSLYNLQSKTNYFDCLFSCAIDVMHNV